MGDLKEELNALVAAGGKSVSRMMPYDEAGTANRPISVHRPGVMPIQSCGQSVSAPRGKAGARVNAHTELRAKRRRSAREAIYRNRPIDARHVINHAAGPRSSHLVPLCDVASINHVT